MNLDLQKQLFDRHPLFFRKPADESDFKPLDQWGIEIGNGWFELLDRLSAKFERAISDCVAQGIPIYECPRAGQIKQKLGELRVYVGRFEGISPSVMAAIAEAERSASQTCESCGQPGSKRHDAWIHVACDQCESTYLTASSTGLATEAEIDQHMKLLRDLLESRCSWKGKRDMTTPDERYRSLIFARRFFVDIQTGRIDPTEFQNIATGILRHFPSAHDLATAACYAPHVFAVPDHENQHWNAVQSVSSCLGIPLQEAAELVGNEFRAAKALDLIKQIGGAFDSMEMDSKQKVRWLHSTKNEYFEGETPFRFMCRGLGEIEIVLTYLLFLQEGGVS